MVDARKLVKIQCCDDETVEVDAEDIKNASTLVKGLMEDNGYPDIEDDAVIEVTNVSKPIMEKCMSFYAKMREDGKDELQIEQPLPSNKLEDHVEEWYFNYITTDIDQAILFDIVLAANHMDMKALLKLGSAKIAALIKGKSIEEIRQFFQMDNDFTPEEEERIREENQFAAEYF